ncbi:MAG: hypothetical protein Ct9H90mP6_04840 [Gammaproteobacteria bacterium]|nr:MAG: hypothetical protein Ct9H90mP6_04840 [Gammaproteobacteria bacterium]
MKAFMCGLGYMHPDWGHGHDKGDNATHFDEYDLNEDPGDPHIFMFRLFRSHIKIGDKAYEGRVF